LDFSARRGYIGCTSQRQATLRAAVKCDIFAGMSFDADLEVLDAALTLIHSRQHVSPKRLGDPGPDSEQIRQILTAAGAAPDHGRLTPWRLVLIPAERRHLLAEVFGRALVERDAAATEQQIREAREKAYRGPFLVMVIARLDPALGPVHPRERLISAGCAIQNMLLTAHAMGFGAGLASGRALYSEHMRLLFNLGADEQPLCFVSVGTVRTGKSPRPRPFPDLYTTTL
jgi:nitroreductase